jgi:hypothetical protein
MLYKNFCTPFLYKIMKKTLRIISRNWLWIIAFTIGMHACKGTDGDIGPAGAQGPQGTAGVAGPAGPAGAANLIVSAWTKVPANVWIRNQDSTYFMVSRDDNNITQAILDSALVMAYYRNEGRPNVVFSLPSSNELLTLGYFMQIRENKGTMNFDLTFYERRLIPINFDLEFRWIIVPPKARGRLKSIDFTDYQQVKQEFGLSD